MLFKVDTYAAPAVDVVEVGVERGFDGSGGGYFAATTEGWEKGEDIYGTAD